MSAVEERLRDTLAQHAGPPTGGQMPTILRNRVRRRRAVLAGSALMLTAAAVVGIVVLSQTIPRAGRSGNGSAVASSTLGDVPATWPRLEIDAAVAWVPSVTDDATVVDGPTPLVAGTADGNAFTLYGYTALEHGERVQCLGFVGFAPPGTPLSDAVDVGACAGASAPIPEAADLDMIGGGSSVGMPIEANFGFVSERVRGIGVWGGGDSGEFSVALLDGLDGWKLAPFLFIPSDDAGPVTVYAAGRQPVATADPCPASDVAGSCRAEVRQLAPAGVGPAPTSGPAGWPTVTLGGDFEPYVDHVQDQQGTLDPGVIGEKHVVEYGTVNGIPWSLTGFAAAGGDWTGSAGPDGSPGPVGELFLGAQGSMGGAGISLYSTQPWSPNDLGASGVAFGDAELSGYAGVISSNVASVELRPEDGDAVSVTLVETVQASRRAIASASIAASSPTPIMSDERLVRRKCVPRKNSPGAETDSPSRWIGNPVASNAPRTSIHSP
jgi:hypothetical protein